MGEFYWVKMIRIQIRALSQRSDPDSVFSLRSDPDLVFLTKVRSGCGNNGGLENLGEANYESTGPSH